MKKRRNILLFPIVVLTVVAGLAVVLVYSRPILLKPLAGSGRILTSRLNAEVKVDGKFDPSFRCFRAATYFDGSPADLIVVYNTVPSNSYNETFIVDVEKKEAGLPNSGNENYFLLLDRFLFQSESGAGNVFFSDVKFDTFDPQYVFEHNYIKFDLPTHFAARTFEIFLVD